MFSDFRYAFRQLAKSPGFTFVAIVTLALGIGANTAVFSVVDAVLLRALPYHNADRLIQVSTTTPTGSRDAVSVPEFEDLREQMRSVEDLAGRRAGGILVRVARRDGDDERDDSTQAAVESGLTRSVVGDPPGRASGAIDCGAVRI